MNRVGKPLILWFYPVVLVQRPHAIDERGADSHSCRALGMQTRENTRTYYTLYYTMPANPNLGAGSAHAGDVEDNF